MPPKAVLLVENEKELLALIGSQQKVIIFLNFGSGISRVRQFGSDQKWIPIRLDQDRAESGACGALVLNSIFGIFGCIWDKVRWLIGVMEGGCGYHRGASY